jgi:redox-sensing transcriptional repressor
MPKDIFKLSPSLLTLRRLARYMCILQQFPEGENLEISSSRLAKLANVKPSQLRQDFHYFGGFGKPGHPYDTGLLKEELLKVFGLEKPLNLLLAGATSWAETLIQCPSMSSMNVMIKGVVDFNANNIGEKFLHCPLIPPTKLPEFLRKNEIAVVVLCAMEPEPYLKLLMNHGLNTFWNLSPRYLIPPPGIRIQQESLMCSLLPMVYELKQDKR